MMFLVMIGLFNIAALLSGMLVGKVEFIISKVKGLYSMVSDEKQR